MIQSVSFCATMATKVMVFKKEYVNTMEPGVDESLFVKVSSRIFTFRWKIVWWFRREDHTSIFPKPPPSSTSSNYENGHWRFPLSKSDCKVSIARIWVLMLSVCLFVCYFFFSFFIWKKSGNNSQNLFQNSATNFEKRLLPTDFNYNHHLTLELVRSFIRQSYWFLLFSC